MAQLYKDAGKDRKFEIVLFDYDDSDKAMQKYLEKSKIGFPALKLSETKGHPFTKIGESEYIPNLVMVSPEGKMLSNDQNEVLKKLKAAK